VSRIIVHLDADAFYASVEQAADSRLRGKPMAVGGEKRGVIASASYEARKFGVRSAMPTAQARRLCPKLIVLPGDYERYELFSQWMFAYCHDFTPEVEQTSIDEGYYELSAVSKPAVEVAETVRRAIGQRLRITVSEGIASNKLVSAIASKLNKPAGFQQIQAGRETEFLHPLPAKWLPGVGPVLEGRLHAAGLSWIRQVASTPTEMLHLLVGAQAPVLRQFAMGIDERPLLAAREPQKTFSQQETFASDLTDEGYVEALLRRMADRLFASVRAEGRSVRTLTVKVRYNDLAEDQASESLVEPTDLETDVYGRLAWLLHKAWKRRVSLRLVSLKLSQVHSACFRSELPLEARTRQQLATARLAPVIDELRRVRGHGVILRGHDFRLREPPLADLASASAPASARGATAGVRVRLRPLGGKPATPEPYVSLRNRSHYTFLDSTLSPASIVGLAKAHGMPAVGLTDIGNLHGVVEFVQAARAAGIQPILGAEVRLERGTLVLHVENARGYHHLCRILSRQADRAAARGEGESVANQQRAVLRPEMLAGQTEGLVAVSDDVSLADLFPGRFYRLVTGRPAAGKFPAVAAPAVHHGLPTERQKFDILQSIRTLTLLREPHPEKRMGGRLHFRTPAEMRVGCAATPEWLEHGREIAERCRFEMPFGKPQFPVFAAPDGSTSREFLRRLVGEGLRRRYGERFRRHEAQVDEELGIIGEVGYEDYFLITWDILQECRRRGISWITRGSAADSLVCYCLGISDVCPIRFDLYFRRFLNRERMSLNKLPDIDLDFPHDAKDTVVELIFAKYGTGHCAVVGGFSTFQMRSAFAEVAKVLGVAEREVRRFTERFPWSFRDPTAPDTVDTRSLAERLQGNLEARDLPVEEEPYRTALETAVFLDGMPRYPKMHPCGVVLSRQPMLELTPTFIAAKGYPTTHLDMDAVEAVGLVKMDILAQGGLAAMRDVTRWLQARGIALDLDRCVARDAATGALIQGDPTTPEPWVDPKVWSMIASGQARAVHHIESPAMTSLCRMSAVKDIDGLVAIVSVIRPGAANEGKKMSFTRRYQGLEPVTYPDPSLAACLRSTFGLVVYEEHILQICEAFAGLSPGRADVLRRALNKQKQDVLLEIHGEFVASATRRGHAMAKIEEVWDLVTGFAGYAFCKAHSTAYGVEAYQSAWLKQYFPVEFMGAVLSNGKGFYDPLVYVLECHRLGIRLRPPTVNAPGPMFEPEGSFLRVPLTRVKGLTERTCLQILKARQEGAFRSQVDFYHRVAPSREEFEAMIRVGAFDVFGETRTRQFWQAQHLCTTYGSTKDPNQGWLLPPAGLEALPSVPLEEPGRRQRLQWETELLGFAVSGHPLDLHDDIAWETYCPVERLAGHAGETIVTCGLVVEQRTHHQVTGEPMKFMTLADYTGMVETELFAQTYRSHALSTIRYPVLEVEARVEPFENGHGFSLRVLRAGAPRKRWEKEFQV